MINGTAIGTPVVTRDDARAAAVEVARQVRLRSASLLSGTAEGPVGQPLHSSPFVLLSGREREVVALIADGLSTKEVAARLFVSIKTIETHRQHAFDKLNLSGVAGLTKYAVREGLSSLDG